MSLLAHREGQRTELGRMQKTLQNCLSELPELFKETVDIEEKDERIQDDIEELLKRVKQRFSRVREETCRVAVIGLEKAGKSTFINAWFGGQALPSDTNRCTWASTTIRKGENYEAHIQFATEAEFNANLDRLYDDVFGKGSRGRIGFPLPADSELVDKWGLKAFDMRRPEFQDIRDLGDFWSDIEPHLDKPTHLISGNSISDLQDKVFPYISRISKAGEKTGSAYAVKQVDIYIPMKDDNLPNFTIDDLPGTNAPGNRAEKMTFDVIRDSADAIVFLKNATANASLDRNEEAIWKVAVDSDESIKLREKIFAVMTNADIPKDENNRDAHEESAKNFVKAGVPKDRIFYGSSRAELFNAVKKDLTFEYNKIDYEKDCKKVGGYFDKSGSTTTTGFPEFKNALYKFLKDDFPGLEQRAFEELNRDYNTIAERVNKIMAACSDAVLSESGASREENVKFEVLWMPNDETEGERGLGTKIYQKVNQKVQEVKETPKNREYILKTIRDTINASKEQFLKEITEEGFTSIINNHSPKNLTATRSEYFEKKQKALKDIIYKNLAFGISHNISDSLQDIWNVAMQAKSEETANGLEVINESDVKEFLQKKLKGEKKSNSALKHLPFLKPDEGKITTAQISFAALLKSVAHAPAEYLLSSDIERYEDKNKQLLQKACIYETLINDEETRKKLEKARNEFKTNYKEYGAAENRDKANGILKMIKDNAMAIDMVLDIILPGPVSTLSSFLLMYLSKAKDPSKPFDGLSEQNQPFKTEKKPVSDEEHAKAAVKDIKERVELFYIVLEAMLFDPDFGFIGYYCSFLEEFRSDLEKELKVGGAIQELAFKYRNQIWQGEPLFQGDARRKRVQDRIAKLLKLFN